MTRIHIQPEAEALIGEGPGFRYPFKAVLPTWCSVRTLDAPCLRGSMRPADGFARSVRFDPAEAERWPDCLTDVGVRNGSASRVCGNSPVVSRRHKGLQLEPLREGWAIAAEVRREVPPQTGGQVETLTTFALSAWQWRVC